MQHAYIHRPWLQLVHLILCLQTAYGRQKSKAYKVPAHKDPWYAVMCSPHTKAAPSGVVFVHHSTQYCPAPGAILHGQLAMEG